MTHKGFDNHTIDSIMFDKIPSFSTQRERVHAKLAVTIFTRELPFSYSAKQSAYLSMAIHTREKGVKSLSYVDVGTTPIQSKQRLGDYCCKVGYLRPTGTSAVTANAHHAE